MNTFISSHNGKKQTISINKKCLKYNTSENQYNENSV